MCFVWISEQTAIISLYSINLSVFKTEAESVYCAVRNGSLNQTATVSYLKGYAGEWSLLTFFVISRSYFTIVSHTHHGREKVLPFEASLRPTNMILAFLFLQSAMYGK